MIKFLSITSQKEGLTNKVHIVLGNEACDLDSAAAAITYAYYLDSVSTSPMFVLFCACMLFLDGNVDLVWGQSM